jgi:anti-sigma factor RsiW
MTEEPADLELHAYVDNELDDVERFAVETHLARHPEVAARVMGYLSARTGLRLISRREGAIPDRLLKQGAALKPGASHPIWRRAVPLGGIGIAAAVLFALFTTSNPPRYVDMAVASHRVAMMRATMVSQVEGQMLDHREILASTRIVLPALPSDWSITDVQLFPTGKNPALLVAVTTGAGKRLSIFATRQRSDAPAIPDAVQEGAQSVAYWRRGEMSYALTGEDDPVTIDRTAESLNRFWS